MMKKTFGTVLATVTACAIALPVAANATPSPVQEQALAYYSNTPTAPQSKTPAAFRKFLSNEQPQFDLQSYPMYGSLIENDGDITTFSVMSQQSNHIAPTLPGIGYALEGVMWNTGKGFTLGGVEGVPEYTLPFVMTQTPWSIRAQALSLGESPQFVDMRIVEGKIGQKGSVYEITADLNAGQFGKNGSTPSTVYVRATDTLGMTQWGFGPSGFSPQWLYPGQREKIVNKYDGSVENYLKATNDPMRGQGSYYYTAPMLKVNSFKIVEGGRTVSQGSGGWLLMDAVTQSFGPNAEKIVKNDVTWIEFSTQFPKIGKAMKVGQVTQATVGTYPYASLTDTTLQGNPNGTVATRKWNVGDIKIMPVSGHEWVSPRTGLKYHLKYKATLKNPNGPDTVLTYTAVFPDQEVAFPGGRAVYEGLYHVEGVLDGERVTGQAWAEVQPAGSLS